jgi:hypothetical protein
VGERGGAYATFECGLWFGWESSPPAEGSTNEDIEAAAERLARSMLSCPSLVRECRKVGTRCAGLRGGCRRQERESARRSEATTPRRRPRPARHEAPSGGVEHMENAERRRPAAPAETWLDSLFSHLFSFRVAVVAALETRERARADSIVRGC